MKKRLKETVRWLREKLTRMNQAVLSFPVWLVVGLAGKLKRGRRDGWSKSEKNDSYGKMY